MRKGRGKPSTNPSWLRRRRPRLVTGAYPSSSRGIPRWRPRWRTRTSRGPRRGRRGNGKRSIPRSPHGTAWQPWARARHAAFAGRRFTQREAPSSTDSAASASAGFCQRSVSHRVPARTNWARERKMPTVCRGQRAYWQWSDDGNSPAANPFAVFPEDQDLPPFRFSLLASLAVAGCVCLGLPVQAQHGGYHGGGFYHGGYCRGGFLPYRGYFPGFVGIYIGPAYGYPYYYPPPVVVVPPPVYVKPAPTVIQVPAAAAPLQSSPPPLAPFPPAPHPVENPK
jgi:hypothetical protein